MRDVYGVLAVSGGYAAAVIGAGFASGQEIVSFFVKYGRGGIIGIAAAAIVFALFSYIVLRVCVIKDTYSYGGVLKILLPNAYMEKAAKLAVLGCAVSTMCVMTACVGELCFVLTGLPEVAGAAVFTALCGVVFLLDGRKTMCINSTVGIVLIFGIVLSCFIILRFRENQAFSFSNAAASGLSYAGYNIIGAGAVLAASGSLVRRRGEAAAVALVSGAVLFIMITLIWAVLAIYYGKINLGEIPMLTMTLRQGGGLGLFYGIMLLCASFTTSISNGFAVMDMLKNKLPRGMIILIMLSVSFCMSGAGFSALINALYTLFGYAGAFMAAVIITSGVFVIKNKKNGENERKQKKI